MATNGYAPITAATGAVSVAIGGTSATSLTGILIGNGTNAFTTASYTAMTTYSPVVTLVGGAGNTTPVYTTNTGRYETKGKTTFVEIYLNGDGGNEGAGSGVINVALPTAAGGSAPDGAFVAGTATNSASNWVVGGKIAGGATTVALQIKDTTTGIRDMVGSDQNTATRTIRLQFTYENA